MTLLDDHTLTDDDAFIVVSKAKGSEYAVLHIRGDIGDIIGLLELVEQSIGGQPTGLTKH